MKDKTREDERQEPLVQITTPHVALNCLINSSLSGNSFDKSALQLSFSKIINQLGRQFSLPRIINHVQRAFLAGSVESHKHFATGNEKLQKTAIRAIASHSLHHQEVEEELRHLVQSSSEYACCWSPCFADVAFGCSELSIAGSASARMFPHQLRASGEFRGCQGRKRT